MRKYAIPTYLSAIVFGTILTLTAAPLGAQITTTTVHEVPPSAKKAKGTSKPAPEDADQQAANTGKPLLPAVFAGWQSSGPPKPLADPAQADSANAAALKEYGFTDGLLGSYSRDSETLTIRALRFSDASGAYGAYSFYRPTNWPKVDVGTGGASNGNRALFWIGNVVFDANFSRISAMSAAELRELAKSTPVPGGTKTLPPPILGNLPQQDMEGQSTHYALGAVGYAGPAGAATSNGVLPSGLVGFDHGAEAVSANYSLRSGPATLTLINYPTPQIAQAQEKLISDYLKAGNTPQHPWTKALQDSNPMAISVRRSGPLLALVSGDPIQDEAHKLLERVHYEVDMSAIPGGPDRVIQNYARLIIGIIVLVLVMFGVAVLVAGFLGGGRAAYRVLRGKPASSMYDDEFIRLDLRD